MGARIKNEIITVGEIDNYERMRVKMKISIRITIKMKTRMKITIKVPISCLGILHICNLWILLTKMLSSWTFLLLNVTEVTSNQESVL